MKFLCLILVMSHFAPTANAGLCSLFMGQQPYKVIGNDIVLTDGTHLSDRFSSDKLKFFQENQTYIQQWKVLELFSGSSIHWENTGKTLGITGNHSKLGRVLAIFRTDGTVSINIYSNSGAELDRLRLAEQKFIELVTKTPKSPFSKKFKAADGPVPIGGSGIRVELGKNNEVDDNYDFLNLLMNFISQ